MNIDWSNAPEDATHAGIAKMFQIPVFYKDIREDKYSYWYDEGSAWLEDTIGRPACTHLIERPKKQEAWGGEGLPPVGLDVLAKVDFKKAPPYTIINLTEIGIDVQNSMPSFHTAKVLYASEKYVILLSLGGECMAPRSCVEFKKIKTPEQLAEEEKKEAINQICIDAGCPEITPGQLRVAEILYDKGYRKQ